MKLKFANFKFGNCGFLHFAILYTNLKDASCALTGVCKKFENNTDCSFISDNLRAKNLRGFPDKLLWLSGVSVY